VAIPAPLAKAFKKVEAKLEGKYVWGLPHYTLDSKFKLNLVELGDLDLFEENEVDTDEIGPWLPLAVFDKDEPQFLCVSTKAPFAVGMWEHETGKVHPLAESLDALAKSVLAKKSDKTPFEKLAKDLEKAAKLINDDKKAAALKLLEPVMATLPTPIEGRAYDDDDQARAWNLYGMALEGVKRLPEAKVAYERAIAAGDDYAMLNLLDMFEDAEDPKSLLASGLKLREDGVWDPYVKIWLARYLAVGYAASGKAKQAEAELRDSAAEFGVKEADKLTKARESLIEYIGKGKPGSKLLAKWVDAYKPASYQVTPGQAKGLRAWWKALPEPLRKTLLKQVNKQTDDDETIARTKDVTSIYVREGTFDDVTIFLDFPNLESLSFDGDPDSIEPLRALNKLERLSINNDVIKNFEWPSRATREFWKACEAGDQKAVEKALKAGADLHSRGRSGSNAFDLARTNPALQTWLVAKGVDPWAGSEFDDGTRLGQADTTYAAEANKAGIPHPDQDPWRELGSGGAPGSATFEFQSKDSLDDGISLKGKFPKTAKLKMAAPKRDNKLHDLHSIGYHSGLVVSERLAKLLEGPNVEIFPVTIVDHAGKVRPEKYFFVNPLAIKAMVIEKCFPSWNHIDPESMSGAAAFVIDAKRVGKAKLFRLAETNHHHVIIASDLAAKLAGMTGVWLKYAKR
jgi:hypothetical protein